VHSLAALGWKLSAQGRWILMWSQYKQYRQLGVSNLCKQLEQSQFYRVKFEDSIHHSLLKSWLILWNIVSSTCISNHFRYPKVPDQLTRNIISVKNKGKQKRWMRMSSSWVASFENVFSFRIDQSLHNSHDFTVCKCSSFSTPICP
jgi:hypothetical protein